MTENKNREHNPTLKTVIEDITTVLNQGPQKSQNYNALSIIEHLIKEKFTQPQNVIVLGQRMLQNTDTKL